MTDEEMTARGWTYFDAENPPGQWVGARGCLWFSDGWNWTDNGGRVHGPFATLADAVRAAEGESK